MVFKPLSPTFFHLAPLCGTFNKGQVLFPYISTISRPFSKWGRFSKAVKRGLILLLPIGRRL
jgi:hypothetical protein